ncbi:hypothetical protein ACA040_004344 [Xenophilus aerolatus]
MPTPIHEKLRKRLCVDLAAALGSATFSFAGADANDFFEKSEEILSALPRDARMRIESAVGPGGLAPYFIDLLDEKFSAQLSRKVDGNFAELDGFDASEIAHEFLAFIEEIPKPYLFVFTLPNALALQHQKRNVPAIIGERFSVVGTWHREAENFPMLPKASVLERTLKNRKTVRLKTDFLFVCVVADGIMRGNIHSETPSIALQTLRSFLGLAVANSVFTHAGFPLGRGFEEVQVFDGDKQVDEVSLSVADAEFLRALRLGVVNFETDTYIRVCEFVDGKHPSENLNLAGKWFSESLANSDQVMAFMQAAIVMEVLLGGSKPDEAGLTEMLSNRCAYLIARTITERQEILQEFRQIYRTRSKIVHNGVSTLNSEERAQLARLRGLCSRVLRKETSLHISAIQEI